MASLGGLLSTFRDIPVQFAGTKILLWGKILLELVRKVQTLLQITVGLSSSSESDASSSGLPVVIHR